MSFVNQIVVTTAVAEFCQQLEHRLAKDGEFATCLLQTNWATFAQRSASFQKELAKDTAKQLKWMDRLIEAEAKARAQAEAEAKAVEKASSKKAVKKATKQQETETRVVTGLGDKKSKLLQ